MRNEDIIVYGFWAVSFGLTLVLAIRAVWRGYTNKSLSAVYWRERKLFAAVLSSVSLLLFILGFDQLVRGSWQAESKAYLDDRFYELKLQIANERASYCGRNDDPSKKLCSAWTNIDNGFVIDFSRRGHTLSPITDWQRFEVIPIETKDRLNRIIGQINTTAPSAASRLLLPAEYRVLVAVVATLALIVAVAGSIGEAAFQLQQAEDAEKRAAEAVVVSPPKRAKSGRRWAIKA